jgi:hypothetical protein
MSESSILAAIDIAAEHVAAKFVGYVTRPQVFIALGEWALTSKGEARTAESDRAVIELVKWGTEWAEQRRAVQVGYEVRDQHTYRRDEVLQFLPYALLGRLPGSTAYSDDPSSPKDAAYGGNELAVMADIRGAIQKSQSWVTLALTEAYVNDYDFVHIGSMHRMDSDHAEDHLNLAVTAVLRTLNTRGTE